MVINEASLYQYSICPLRVWPSDPFYGLSPIESCFYEVLKWGIRESFNGIRPPKLKDIQDYFNNLGWVNRDNKKEYTESLEDSIVFCKKLSVLLASYGIIKPISSYELNVKDKRVYGSYGILTDKSNHFIVLREVGSSTIRSEKPDIMTLTRMYHTYFNTEQNPWYYSFELLGRGQGLLNKHTLNIDKTKQILYGIIDSYEKSYYPSPGEHCKTCKTIACEGAFNE